MAITQRVRAPLDNTKKRQLAQQVAQLFFYAEVNGLEANQSGVFGEVLCKLLNHLEMPEQVNLSERISHSVVAPLDLVRKLAIADIEIAKPVLINSKLLSDKDLLMISAARSPAHRVAMSGRQYLSEMVTDRLIRLQEIDVMVGISKNETAKISDEGFSTLASVSLSEQALMQSLAKREDLPADTAEALLSRLDDYGRTQLSAILQDNERVFTELEESSNSLPSKTKIEEARRRMRTKRMLVEVQEGKRELNELLILLAEEQRPKCIAYVFSVLSKLSEKRTYHGIISTNGEMLTLMSKSLDIPFSVFKDIDRMRQNTVRLPSTPEARLMDEYSSITKAEALDTLRLYANFNDDSAMN